MNHQSFPATIGAIPVKHRTTRRKPMPLLTAALTIPVIATAFALPATALIIEQPRAVDMYAALGAILASLIALIEARYKGRDFGPAMSNFLACAVAGSLAPKLVYLLLLQWGWITAEAHIVRAWEAWAAAGFMLGMNGWWLIHKVTAIIKSMFPKGKR
jgi:predicted membrane protein